MDLSSFQPKHSYYWCPCGGTFYVDLRAQSYGIYPCTYRYICDQCKAGKSMPCLAEVEACREISEVEKLPAKRVFKITK